VTAGDSAPAGSHSRGQNEPENIAGSSVDETAENSAARAPSSAANPEGESSEIDLVALQNRVGALSEQVRSLHDELDAERELRAALEEETDRLRERAAELEVRVDHLDERTDLLELVDTADQLNGEQRAVALVQHLHRAAERRRERDEVPAAELDRDEAEQALHYPDVERTTIYRDMERAARLVRNERVLWYEDGRLKLDLESGELQPSYRTDRRGV
jgi:chromosome segregation ATPase